MKISPEDLIIPNLKAQDLKVLLESFFGFRYGFLLCGLDVFRKIQHRPYEISLRVFQLLLLMSQMLVILFQVSDTTIYIMYGNTRLLASSIGSCSFSIISSITYLYALLNSGKLKQVMTITLARLEDCSREDSRNLKSIKSKLRLRSNMMVLAVVLYTAATCGMTVYSDNLTGKALIRNILKMTQETHSVILVVVYLGWFITSVASFTLLSALFSVMVSSVGCTFPQYLRCNSAVTSNKERCFHKFMKDHEKCCQVVRAIESFFAPLLFLWMSNAVFNFCLQILSINTFIRFGVDLRFFSSLATYIANFGITCFAAILLNDQITSSVSVFKHLEEKGNLKDALQTEEPLVYFLLLDACPVKLTGWKFFNVDMGFMLAVFGMLLTFVIMIIDLK